MDAALKDVNALVRCLSKFEANLKKCSTVNRTKGYLDGRIVELKRLWDEIRQADKVMLSLLTNATEKEDYYANDVFSNLEEKYAELVGKINEYLETFKPKQQSTNPQNQNNAPPNNDPEVKLPRIELPTFSGSYHEWKSFKDSFSTLIHNNNKVANVSKFNYLKSCLEGNAETAVQRYQVTDQNYVLAWNRLNEIYENQRILQDTEIETLIDRRVISRESAKELRELMDVIQESLEALKNLNVDVSGWDPILVVLVRRKLPFKTREEWEKELQPKEVPTFKQLMDFLEKRFRTVENLELVGEATNFQRSNKSNQLYQKNNNQQRPERKMCIACNNERHNLKICETFLNMNPSNRNAFVKAKNLCRMCLGDNHTTKECRSTRTCFNCHGKHNTVLHREEFGQNQSREPTYTNQSFQTQSYSRSNNYRSDQNQNKSQSVENRGNQANRSAEPSNQSTSSNNQEEIKKSYTTTTLGSESMDQEVNKKMKRETLFPTAIINVESEGGVIFKIRALLDQCSDDEAFIKESTAKMLGLKQFEIPAFEVAGIDEVITAKINKATRIKMIISKQEKIEVEASIVKNLVGVLPKTEIKWPEKTFRNLKLADPRFATPDNVDVMLGGKIYSEIVESGVLKEGGYLAQNTKLGWIISGQSIQEKQKQRSTCLHTRIVTSSEEVHQTDEILRKFWEIEEAPRMQKKLTKEEQDCEEIFKQSYRRLEDGRVQVKLPFKEKPNEVLGESRSQAVARWLSMERKLEKDDQLKKDYMAAIQEHLDLGHMKLAKTSEKDHKSYSNGKSTFSCYYIPHHAVVKEESKTTKTRIVFDASAKTSTKKSLNDILMVGATIQESLIVRLMKWRIHRYVIRGDVTKMYRQIKVYEEDENYQRMVFRFNKNEPIQDFCLNTLTFGTASAPFMAIRSLKQVAMDDELKYPEGSKVIQNDFHVDDLLTGADSVEGVKEIWSQINQILKSAKFPMRKWSSNDNSILDKIPKEEREFKGSEIKIEDSLKTLGIGWLPIADQFFFTIPEYENEQRLTKRIFLSQAAKLFDPLGWLGPAVMKPKIMFQKLWKEKKNWDEEMPEELANEWIMFRSKLNELEQIRIPRWFGFTTKNYKTELHGFSDASESAHGAVIYLKSTNEVGNSKVEIVLAKSRVAPVKKVRLPRLELCAGVLLANVMDLVKSELGIETFYCWTDSSITLDWIDSEAHKHKTFVANRISEIQELTEPSNWRHVEGTQNPADCLSRGIDPDELKNHKLWWNGPNWLKLPKEQWPKNPKVKIPEDQLELKGKKNLLTVKRLNGILEYMLDRYSSFKLLARVTARIKTLSKKGPRSKYLTVNEIEKGKIFWIKLAQEASFSSEIESLKLNEPINRKSKILSLYPFVDSEGVLRVGGRLNNAKIENEYKHQILIPKDSKIAKMIISDAHETTKHGGTQVTVTYTRNNYWIIDTRRTVRNQIHKCVTCHRYSKKMQKQLMGTLPEARVNMVRAFVHTGVDYAGPIEVLTERKPGRRKATKGYVAVFVCLCTKAIHLEIVSRLTTEAFQAAFTRFHSRRGLPTNMYSDFRFIFKEIGQNFGIQMKQKIKKIMVTNKKLASLRARNSFLVQCRRHKILPKSLTINLKGFKHCIAEGVISRLSKSFSQTLLNEVISEQYENISRNQNTMTSLMNNIKDIIPTDIVNEFGENVQTIYQSKYQLCLKKQEQKLNNLLKPESKNINKILNQDNWIKNLTRQEIPQPVKNILGLGHKFNLQTDNKRIPNNEIIADLEPTIQKLDNASNRIELRNKLCNILTNHRRLRSKKTTCEVLLHKQFQETKTFLKENQEFLVINADKGNVTVLIKKEDYEKKMQSLLVDEKTYRILPEDPTKKIEAKCNRLISNWKKQNHINAYNARRLRRYNSVIAKLYGQIKIHKDGEPPRPVVASIDSPTYNLSKMFAKILKNVTGKTRRSIKNSEEFKEKLKNIRIPEGYVIVSLDVVSLFTKIPKELVYQAINKQWFRIKKFTTLPKKEFIKGIKMVMENCTFSYGNTIYEQIFGSPMGSPVSKVLADLVLETLEEETIKKLKFRLPFFSRFVDDCITPSPADKTDELKQVFNEYNADIQFTIDKEENQQIPFLDTLLIRQDDGFIKTNWFHKKTWSGRYLNYFSSLPFSYKRNTISILAEKILKLANTEFHESNFSILKETLKKNGYPEKLIHSTIEQTKRKVKYTTQNETSTKKRFVSIPYIKGAFEKIKKTFNKYDITVVGRGENNLKKSLFTKIKDQVPTLKQSNVIYKIKCSCRKVYIGQTMQLLEKRISDHQYHIRTGNDKHSALCDHVINQEPNTQHIVNWKDIQILHRETKKHSRDVMEMIHIKTTNNTINKQIECKFLSNTYNNILKGEIDSNKQ